MLRTAELVSAYTARFSAQYLTEHGAGSGLGVWLLLALLAPAVQGTERAELEAVLGTDAVDASARARELLAEPHPAVRSAIALWARSEWMTAAFDAWAAGLGDDVRRGDIPTQTEADAWADAATLGMIRQFPLQLDGRTAVVLSSALATAVTWMVPFEQAPAEDLGGEFGPTIQVTLVAPPRHRQLLATTEAAGLVAVHAADATDGLLVISVIAAPDVAPASVHAAAAEVARLLAGHNGPGTATAIDLFDLPLGDGHAWTLTEQKEVVASSRERPQSVTAHLAAWTAKGDHDLADAPGVPQVGAAMIDFIDPDLGGARWFEARQVAFAQSTRTGFRAGALSGAISLGASHIPDRRALARDATIRFNRPYAMLAVAAERRAWDGVPVFSAWIERVDDSEPDPEYADILRRLARRVRIR